MDAELRGMLDRAGELLVTLEEEYNSCLKAQNVTERAKNITHEILEKLRNALDHTMRKAWERYISQGLSSQDIRRARIYFPICDDLSSFRSTLGRGIMADLDITNPHLYSFLLDLQPFSSSENNWLRILREVAAKGKHIKLMAQKREEFRRINVIALRGEGSVSWDPSSVRFGSGVRILGAPIDPRTQRVVPTPGVSERIETWVSFTLEGYGVNAIGFCREAYDNTSKVVKDMISIFRL